MHKRKTHMNRTQSTVSIPTSDSDILAPLTETPSEYVLMVSNRLPVSATQKSDGEWELTVRSS